MNSADTFALLDSCVLLKQRVSDVLMDLHAEGVFSAHWTEAIDEEFRRNLPRLLAIAPQRVDARMAAMKRRCPDWRVPFGELEMSLVPRQVHDGDRHVAAGAIALRRALDGPAQPADARVDEFGEEQTLVLLVTDNVRHLSAPAMADLGVTVISSGAFLDEAFAQAADATLRAVLRTVEDL